MKQPEQELAESKNYYHCTYTCMLMQEMEGCDIGEDPDFDGVHSDSDKTVETEVNVFVVNKVLHTAVICAGLRTLQEAVSIAAALNHSVPCLR